MKSTWVSAFNNVGLDAGRLFSASAASRKTQSASTYTPTTTLGPEYLELFLVPQYEKLVVVDLAMLHATEFWGASAPREPSQLTVALTLAHPHLHHDYLRTYCLGDYIFLGDYMGD